MFEQPVGKVEKDRSKLIIGISAVAVLAVVVLIVLVSSFSSGTQKALEMAQIGSAEFDAYAKNINLDILNRVKGERFVSSKYIRTICLLKNDGDKILTGLQVKLIAVRYLGEDTKQYEIVKEKVITPIPTMRDSLGPHQSAQFEFYLEPLDDPDSINDTLVLINGLQVK